MDSTLLAFFIAMALGLALLASAPDPIAAQFGRSAGAHDPQKRPANRSVADIGERYADRCDAMPVSVVPEHAAVRTVSVNEALLASDCAPAAGRAIATEPLARQVRSETAAAAPR